MESNRKEMDYGVKECEKRLGNSHLFVGGQKGRFKGLKHFKLFIYELYDVKELLTNLYP